jgi:hypothetical protein
LLDSLLNWCNDHRPLLYGVGASFLLGFLGLIGATITIVRMRPDALVKEKTKRTTGGGGKGGRAALHIGKNIAGWLLILAGLAMLILPGPGLVVILLGLTLADFPGKRRIQLWIFSRKRILGPINRLRKRFHRPPLQVTTAAA